MFIVFVQLEHTTPQHQGTQDQQLELILAGKFLTLNQLPSEHNIMIR